MTAASPHDLPAAAAETARPPAWLIAATGLLALGTLSLAVAETSLWMHYLIDAGESISLLGLLFIFVAGIYLYRRGRLLASLPLTVPWLLFPVITQGDQIIDNLSINWMRLVCHVLLGLLFGTPVAIAVLGLRFAVAPTPSRPARRLGMWAALVPGLRRLSEGRAREGGALIATLLLAIEMWVAVRFLGTLMVITLIVMIWGVLAYGFARSDAQASAPHRSERFALIVLLCGVALSAGLFFGYKNRPGAYQGSPSYFMDPSQQSTGYRLDAIAVPSQSPSTPIDPEGARAALTAYGQAFQRLLNGYYILDRNYNYDFHNRLFLRSTPLVPGYRAAGLRLAAEAVAMRAAADQAYAVVRPTIPAGDPLGALLDDVHGYAAFTFGRTPVLERMSAGFERTEAGLQHATHLYEGEGKVLGVRLAELLEKHRAALSSPVLQPITIEFVTLSRAVHDKYANRIVGF